MQQYLAEGTIVGAYTTSIAGRVVPALIYDVRLDAAADFGFATPNLERVPTLQAGFSAINPQQEFYAGLVFAPEIGARVVVGITSRGPVIMGFLTGPGSVNGSDNPELTSYNPGIDLAVPRTNGSPGVDDVPSWALDLQPGDVSIGKFTARLKFNDFGAFLGANSSCFTHHGFGGNKIDKWTTREERGVGFWQVARNALVLLTSDAVTSSGFESAPGASWNIAAYDSDPDPIQMAPYVIEQRGFITPEMAAAGKGSAEMAPLLSQITPSRATGKTVVKRSAVLQPLGVPVTPSDEVVAPMHESQVRADGSWRIRGGNRAKQPTWIPQFDLEFDAATGALALTVGDVSAQQVSVRVLNGNVVAKCVSLDADVLGEAKIAAQSLQVGAAEILLKSATTIQIKCPSTVIDGNVAIAGALVVNESIEALRISAPTIAGGAITAATVTGGGIPLSTHTHGGVETGPGSSGPPQ